MTDVKVVIGANFGDEGKGLMTDYFCNEAAEKSQSCIVVCHNGGPQRGHTVVTPDGIRHVFHHFGSGTFAGADTYFAGEFIINPMIFRKEWEDMAGMGCTPEIYVNPLCRVTTPYDMLINQIVEESRGDGRHGSCGMGILETIRRFEKGYGRPALDMFNDEDLRNMSFIKYLQQEYAPARLLELGIKSVGSELASVLGNDNVILNYIDDLNFMREHVKPAPDYVLTDYGCVVFEGGQGLLLDRNNIEYMPNLTPSSTGLDNPVKIMSEVFSRDTNVEVCYVTRTYLTRHGAGRFDTECRKEDINKDMIDLTNVPNPYQGTIRYGKMDITGLDRRITQDFVKAAGMNVKRSLAVTHINETKDLFETSENKSIPDFTGKFDNVYYSDGMHRETVRRS